jgi:alpha-ketoglutarate-dependent taurine dioxygenase
MDFSGRLEIAADAGPVGTARALRDALHSHRVTRVVGGPSGEGALERWAAIWKPIGRMDLRGENPHTLERFEAIWSDIRYDPADNGRTYRHSDTGQPFHTDGAYNADPPDLLIFYCEKQAEEGGETTFIDGPALVSILAAERPQLLDGLRTVPVRFQKGSSPGQALPIIKEDAFGPLFDWNETRVVPGQGQRVEQLVSEFATFLKERFADGRDVLGLKLTVGESLFCHDRRLLHGRRAFRGDRCLWVMFVHYKLDQAAVAGG